MCTWLNKYSHQYGIPYAHWEEKNNILSRSRNCCVLGSTSMLVNKDTELGREKKCPEQKEMATTPRILGREKCVTCTVQLSLPIPHVQYVVCIYICMYVHLVKDEVEVQSLIPENDGVHRPGQWRGQRSVKDN